MLIGSLPPAAFRDWRYLAAGGGAGIAAFLARRLRARVQWSFTVFDAAGLALFCVTGTTTAFAAHLGPFQSVVLGTVTGVAGGTVRDMVIRRVPTVLSSGLYAIPAACGATLTAPALQFHFYGGVIAVAAAAVCFTVRLPGLRFNLHVPVSHPSVTAKPRPASEEDS